MKRDCFVVGPQTGEIIVNQTHGSKKLIDRYADMGQTAKVFPNVPTNLDIGKVFVDVKRDLLLVRPLMSARIDRTEIRANGADAATIVGLPDHCVVRVSDGMTETSCQASGRGFQIVADHPGIYTVTLDAFPHRTRVFQITAR